MWNIDTSDTKNATFLGEFFFPQVICHVDLALILFGFGQDYFTEQEAGKSAQKSGAIR